MNVEECQRVVAKLAREIEFPVPIRCEKWTGDDQTRTARAFFTADALGEPQQNPPVIILLPERFLHGEEELVEAVRHELVHAFDHCTLKLDLTRCEQLACSEIRAAREADCREYGKGVDGWLCQRLGAGTELCANVRKSCVKRVATRSTASVFPPEQAQQCVEAAFERCFGDLRVYRFRTLTVTSPERT